jgi:hypothetical protein
VFYLDEDNDELRCALGLNGLPPGVPWTSKLVSPPGSSSSCPAPVSCPDGSVCCAYITNSHGVPGTDCTLMLATLDPSGDFSSRVLADDVHLPNYLDQDDDCDGFCDMSLSDDGSELVCVYSSPTGFTVLHVNPADGSVRLRESPSRPSSSGAYVRVHAVHNGGVRVCHYDGASREVLYETELPSGDFSSTVLKSFASSSSDPHDYNCDGLDFWLDPDDDGDGFHQAAFAFSTTFTSSLGASKHTKTGHVTLLK